ncbi:hypothetical protein [Streptomyces qinzhouensis]|uniref:Uncharacterized protein n=1 Tax=Streptomyces qinzhouensis TaxID=2599401 RepID=A0A5B8IHK1_9ACTN|nr:hypothetical protein [Streptomyces qinzhouensis]QDY76819.1 hypothetical protein FQU76_10070 [Streptomyces qinzhouensis]
MRLRRANLVITAVAAFAGAGLMAGRVLTGQPEPLDLGPVVVVERSGGYAPGAGEPLPSATSRPPRTGGGESVPPPSRQPSPLPSGSGSDSASAPASAGPSYSAPPRRLSPAPPRNPGGRPVPPLPPPRSDDDGSGRPIPTAGEGDEGEEGDGDGDGEDDRADDDGRAD